MTLSRDTLARLGAVLALLLGAVVASPTSPPASAADYYAGTSGLSGSALEAKLHTIVSTGVTRLSYDDVWTALQDTDQDPANPSNVIELYTGRSIAKSNHGGGVDQWNREHVWAKSHGDFGTSTGPGTDVHHLRPSDVSVNGARGNLDFDEGGTQNSEAPGNYADGDSWEPRDAVKGDVARMVLYMSVRYDGGDGFADLEVNDRTGNGSAPPHRQALHAAGLERPGPAGRLRAAPQRGDLHPLAAQPEPVRRPPGVRRPDLGLTPGRPGTSRSPAGSRSVGSRP